MKVKCGYYGHEYNLIDGLHLKSITTTTHGIVARIELRCPECNHTEYLTIRKDFIGVSKDPSTKSMGGEDEK